MRFFIHLFATISISATRSKTLLPVSAGLRLLSSAVSAISIQLPMATSEESLRLALTEKQAAVDAQADAVRNLKVRSGASQAEIEAAVEALNNLKVEAGAAARRLQAALSGNGGSAAGSREAFRQAVVNTLERRLFYIPSFKIYRGVAGLYDYGPPGCAVKSNVLAFWRQVRPIPWSLLLDRRTDGVIEHKIFPNDFKQKI